MRVKNNNKNFWNSVKVRKLYSQFKIFYRSKYGRTGFYILLAFAVVALISPFIIAHPGYSYIAPEPDTHIPSMIGESPLKTLASSNRSIYPLQTTDVVDSGVRAVYFGEANGTLYYAGINGTASTGIGTSGLLFKCQNTSARISMYRPLIFSVSNCRVILTTGTLTFERIVVLPFSNNKILVGEIGFFKNQETPQFKLISSIRYNGTLVGNLISNAAVLSTALSGDTASIFSAQLNLTHPAEIFFVNSTDGRYNLNAYSIDPEKLIYSTNIHINSVSSFYDLQFYGNLFTYSVGSAQSSILIYNSSSILSFGAYNGTLIWSRQVSGFNENIGLIIPSAYDSSFNATENNAFLVSGNQTVCEINISNGSTHRLFTASQPVFSITTTPGSGGFPTYVMVATHSHLILLYKNEKNQLSNTTISLPVGIGTFYLKGIYDSVSDSFVIISNKGFVLSVNLISGSSTTFDWTYSLTPTPSNVTELSYFFDANIGAGVIGELTPNNHFYLLSASSVGLNPIPPMVNTPTGASFFLGTNNDGNDVWAQFIESFYIDWEFGIGIGLATIFISVGVAMYVGYKGGIGGKVVETASLAMYLIPSLALLIALASILGGKASFVALLAIISLTGWPFAAFTLMGVVRGIKARTYVKASRLFGTKNLSIMRKHILPNIGPLLLYLLALSISGGVGAISGLQFLGIAPLLTPTWGGMLNGALVDYFLVVNAPQWIIPPAVALAMFIFAFIFISRGLDEVVNPRLRRR